MWEKEKLLVPSNFSFSHIVFKRLNLQTGKNQGLFGKGLKEYEILFLSVELDKWINMFAIWQTWSMKYGIEQGLS